MIPRGCLRSGLLFLTFVAPAVCALTSSTILPNQCSDLRPRLEIRDLASQSPDQFTVLLLALNRLKERNSSDPLGYYQLSGIHGYPYTPYNNVGQCQGCDSNMGYCPHISHLFAIWHRPYLAYFERALRDAALRVVGEFPPGAVRNQYMAAAQVIRLPYWDFAKVAAQGDSILPAMFTENQVTLMTPTGRRTIENPLYNFKYNGAAAPPFAGLNNIVTTRHPLKTNATISRQDIAAQNVQQLQDQQGHDIRCGTYRLLFSQTNFDMFAGSAWVNGFINIPFDNIESVHDDIHIAVGGNGADAGGLTNRGTMWYINGAAFDPIFWMHHVMVDRLLGFWQALHPDSWVGSHNGTNTWTIRPDMVVDGNTPLTPFFMDTRGTSWTANASRRLSSFCYFYPDLTPNTTPQQVASTLNSLYGQGCLVNPQSGRGSTNTTTAGPLGNPRRNVVARNTAAKESTSLTTLSQKVNNLVTATGAMRDYITNIRIDSMAIGQTCTVYVFDGPVDANSDATSTADASPNLIGKRTFLMKSGMDNMKDGQRFHKGTVALNAALIARAQSGQLSGLGNDEVTRFLKERMNWSVVLANGTSLPNAQVPGLAVTVVTADVQPASDQSALPVWGNPRLLADITAGKEGGIDAETLAAATVAARSGGGGGGDGFIAQ